MARVGGHFRKYLHRSDVMIEVLTLSNYHYIHQGITTYDGEINLNV